MRGPGTGPSAAPSVLHTKPTGRGGCWGRQASRRGQQTIGQGQLSQLEQSSPLVWAGSRKFDQRGCGWVPPAHGHGVRCITAWPACTNPWMGTRAVVARVQRLVHPPRVGTQPGPSSRPG